MTSPFDILWETQKAVPRLGQLFAREALYSWKPEHSAKLTVIDPQKGVLWVLLGLLVVALAAAPYATAATLMAFFTTIYTLTFLFKFVLTFVGASRKLDVEISPEAIAAIEDTELPAYAVLVPMYKEAAVLPLLASPLREKRRRCPIRLALLLCG